MSPLLESVESLAGRLVPGLRIEPQVPSTGVPHGWRSAATARTPNGAFRVFSALATDASAAIPDTGAPDRFPKILSFVSLA
jgi:hypothetical protein